MTNSNHKRRLAIPGSIGTQAIEAIQAHPDPFAVEVLTAILQPLKLTALPRGAFQQYMKSQGKLGGQNKVPRLSNDRTLADGLLQE